jgi:hypothetical protein
MDIQLNQALSTLREHFTEQYVSRGDILRFLEMTHKKVPVRFWELTKVSRGMHDLHYSPSEIQESEKINQESVVVSLQQQSSPEVIVNRFETSALIPLGNPAYVKWGDYDTVKRLVSSKFCTIYITGPSGCGKNEMLENVCAELKKPLVRVGITRETKEESLIGSKTLVNGNIKYEIGPAIWAAENGGVLVLDELTLGDPSEIMCLQQLLEGKPFFVKSANRIVTPAPGFIIIATDNTKGRGDMSGRYIGTTVQNDAFLERFMVTFTMGYAPDKVEERILRSHLETIKKNLTEIDDKVIASLQKWVNVIRKSHKEEAIDEEISTRRNLFILTTYANLGDIRLAIELCTNRFDDSTKMAFIKLWEGIN